jgi:uncharacterized damage-inducible protein DinB
MRATDIAESIRQARAAFWASIEGLSQEDMRRRPAARDWSIAEILGHLPEADYFYLQQALMGRNLLVHALEYFDDIRWRAEYPTPESVDIDRCLARMQRSHGSALTVVSGLDDEELSRPIAHRRGIPYSVADVFLRLSDHDGVHAAQVWDIRTALGC